MTPKMYGTIVLQPDADEAIAELYYSGEGWASVTLADGILQMTVYGETKVPLDEAMAAQAKVRAGLVELSEGRQSP